MRSNQRLSGALLVLIALSIFIPGYTKVQRESQGPFDMGKRSDFGDYYDAALLLSRGEDPYRMDRIRELRSNRDLFESGLADRAEDIRATLSGVGTYLYPPFTAFLLIPLSALPYEAASVIFQTLSFLSLLIFFVFFYYKYKALWQKEDSSSAESAYRKSDFLAASLLALLVVYTFLLGNATNGNVLFFLLLLSGIGLALSFESGIISIMGGVLIGFAIAIKITPLFFGLVLFSFRRWMAIGGVLAGLAFALAIPSSYTGWEANLALLDGWRGLILESYGRYGIVRAWANNQSISGMVGKLFLPGSDMDQAAYGLPLIKGIPSPDRIARYAGIVRVVNLAIVAAASITALRYYLKNIKINNARAMMGNRSVAMMILLSALVSLLTAGVSWYHAYGILLLPALLRATQAFGGASPSAGEGWALLGVSLFGLFDILFTSSMRTGLALYSIFTLIAFAIFCQTLYALNRRGDGI